MTSDAPVRAEREPGGAAARIRVAGLAFDRVTEADVVGHVVTAVCEGRGGWIATPNVDICRAARRDSAQRRLLAGASLVVPDGMPLIWAARMLGNPLPERVTGSSLIFSLSGQAAASGRSIYLLGGEPGVAALAAAELGRRYPGLIVAGTDAPARGFDTSPDGTAGVLGRLVAASPDIVFVGLGFPKQERLISALAPLLPATWFVGCGAAIPIAAGVLPRAPGWMQEYGLEWVFRLINEPRRLFRRYVVRDLPFAACLFAACAALRLRAVCRRHRSWRRPRR